MSSALRTLFTQVVLAAGVAPVAFAQSQAVPSSPEVLSIYTSQQAEDSQILHLLILGDTTGVRKDLSHRMRENAKVLYALAIAPTTQADARERIFATLRLMAVMAQKDALAEWNNDTQLGAIFKDALSRDPLHSRKLECNDWSKPMWLGAARC